MAKGVAEEDEGDCFLESMCKYWMQDFESCVACYFVFEVLKLLVLFSSDKYPCRMLSSMFLQAELLT